jgi:hypothetical protein
MNPVLPICRSIGGLATIALVAGLAGCAPTKVTTTTEYQGDLPRPGMVFVYDFAASPDEVKLDEGIIAKLGDAGKGTPRTEQERAIGRKMAGVLASKLVTELDNAGIGAQRTSQPQPSGDNVLLLKGQFLSIDEGNQTERVVIGLGMGRSDVKTSVQVYETLTTGPFLVEQFIGDARSGFKPGMAESLGAGAAAGHLGAAAVIGGATTIGSEAFAANIEADADRTAKQLVKQIKQLYKDKGWWWPGE